MTKSVRPPSTPFKFNNFQGFAYPNTTQVPDLLLDHIMQDLDEKELKVLLYIIRRTFGFKKQVDNISLGQLVRGIITRDGRVLDRGTGFSKASVTRALHSLKQKNLINATQNRDPERGNLPTTYSLNMLTAPCLSAETRGVSRERQGLVSQVRHTINSNTTNSKTAAKAKNKSTKTNDSTSNNGAIAAALIEKGIEKKAANQLAKTYTRGRIENNIDWLDWKQKNEPHSIKSNPAGLLRRAIEQDYASESHKGFQTRQQKAAVSMAKKERLQTHEKLVKQREEQLLATLQQREKARVKRLEMLRERHHTGKKEDGIWSQVLESLRKEISNVSIKAYLTPCALLSLQKETALIAVPSTFVKEQIEGRLKQKIERALGDGLNGKTVTIQCLVMDE